MAEFKAGQLLRIFVGECDTWHGAPLHSAIIAVLKRSDMAGASVFRGIEGFGSHREIHLAKIVNLRGKLPILIEVVDDEQKIAAVIPFVEPMISEGAMTLERVEYCRFDRSSRNIGRRSG
jgi:PII-like signaling protein